MERPNKTTGDMLSMYVKGIIRILGGSNPNATEKRKTNFLIRGVKQEIFNTMLCDPPSMVNNFVTITACI